MELKNTVNYLFNQVFNAYRINLEKALGAVGLHSGQIFILISLWSEDRQRQNVIAKNLNLSPPTVNIMIKNLVENGFVKLQKDESDGRATQVLLTKKGVEIRPEVEKIWQELEADIYSNLTETEKMILFQLLEKTLKNLIS
ncbi:MAG: transcriptional regulator, MarR family [Acidobacteria bacterium]|jgi:DNA-binding MarR family transcriptional regulator|nr:transcriptional regulator, MarR family [Acidobacteriota bacterium]